MAPERLQHWLEQFEARHGPAVRSDTGPVVTWAARDGARAEVEVPFPPRALDLVAHALAERRVGILLVRLGGHAAGVAVGPRLVLGKVGRRQVHGRSAAGGWSQQRFARRREGQVRVAHAAAAQTAYEVLLPHVPELAAVVVGGERKAVEAVLADRRLAPLAALVTGRLLDVPDPRRAVLERAPALLREVHIRVVDPQQAEQQG